MPTEPVCGLWVGQHLPCSILAGGDRRSDVLGELKHGLAFPLGLLRSGHASPNPLPALLGWQRQKLPVSEQRMSHEKRTNPGEPAESLESLFLITSSLFLPPSLLCEAFQDLPLLTGISGGQRVPQAQTRCPSAGTHRPSAEHGAPGYQDYTWFFFFLRKSKFQGKIGKKKAVSPPPPPC